MTDPYRIRSAETWAQARNDYLAGLDAEAVCRRHDLGLSAFRRRARKHGWRRVDQDDPTPGETDLSIYDDIDVDDQIETARLRFAQALSHGRATEAMRWRRLWQDLRAENDAFNADFFAGLTPAEMRERLAAFRQERDDEDETFLIPSPTENVHDVHSNFPSAHFPDDTSPLSRAERRRRSREVDRQDVAYRRSASTVPTAPPPETTAPPAMA